MTIPAVALKRLTDQVSAIRGGRVKTLYSDIDGLDRYRSVTFDEETSNWLEPLLEAMADARIAGWTEDDGRIKVTVVGDSRADFKDDFALSVAAGIIHDQPVSPDNVEPPARPVTKKAAAKRRHT